MSNYPPPPTFGTPHNPNPSLPPSHGGRYTGGPSYPYMQPHQHAYMQTQGQGQGQGNGPLPAQHANGFAYNSNGHGQTPVSYMNGMGQPAFANFPGPAQHHALPPPMLPHTIMPPYGRPQYPPPPSLQPATIIEPPLSNHNVLAEGANHQPTTTEIRDEETLNLSTPRTQDLEDGELSDGSTSQTEKSRKHPSHNIAQPVQNDSAPADNQKMDIPPLVESVQQGQQGHKAPRSEPASSSDPRQLAHNILRELHSYGIGYQDILREGYDPDILQQLYFEVGLTEHSSSIKQQQTRSGDLQTEPPHKVAEPRTSLTTAGIENHAEPSRRVLDVPAASKASPNEGRAPSMRQFDNRDINAKAAPISPRVANKEIATSTSIAKPPQLSTNNFQGKPMNKAGDTKAVDRKEYIARMLAAKAGKPMPSSTAASVTSKATADSVSESSSAPISPKPPAPTSEPTVLPEPPSFPDTSTSQSKDDTILQAKRKAQTDLARQKIEALRLKATQHKARTSKQVEPMTRNPRPALETTPQNPDTQEAPTDQSISGPSRQGSYFSPVTQTSAFSIPGLSLSSQTSNPPLQSSSLAKQHDQGTLQVASYVSDSNGARIPDQISTLAEPIKQPNDFPSEDIAMNCVSGEVTGLGPRKRQKAADFIEAPSTRVKRFLGQSDDPSVIIDISDEEDETLDEDLDILIAAEQVVAPRQPETSESEAGRQKMVRDLPPLTDFPPRKRGAHNDSATTTPPLAQTPGKSQEPKVLKTKEMEIEIMKRKIAEMEQQRRKAKDAVSRTQSPGTLRQGTPRQESGRPVTENDTVLNAAKGAGETSDVCTEQSGTRQASIVETEHCEPVSKGQLRSKEAMQDLNTLTTEAEKLGAEEALNSETEEVQQEQENKDLDMKDAESLSTSDQGYTLDNPVDMPPVAQHHATIREIEPKPSRDGGNDQHQQMENFTLPQAIDQGPPVDVGRSIPESSEEQVFLKNKQYRKAEIETNIPKLDAELQRTKDKLQSLRVEIGDLEAKAQQEEKSRQILLEELLHLSQISEAVQLNAESSPVVTEPKSLEGSENVRRALPTSPTHQMRHYSSSQHEDEVTASPALENSVYEQSTSEHSISERSIQRADLPSSGPQQDQVLDHEFEEDVMDISHSDLDEGEISENSPKPPTEEDGAECQEEEMYEPPPDVGLIQQNEPSLSATRTQTDALIEETGAQDSLSIHANGGDAPTGTDKTGELDQTTDMQDNGPLSRQSPLLDYANDTDDDYEPPDGENEPPVSRDFDETTEVRANSPVIALPLDGKIRGISSSVSRGAEGTALEISRQDGQFTPYESPLRQFKSYRFHPEYNKEISTGFRSLTYSNAINSATPICPFELGGGCNDPACTNQHFKDMGLSDNIIIRDMGNTEGSTPEEKEAYVTGLKQLILDLRHRRVNGVNEIAAEITAYRAQSLGDSSRVLSL